MIMYRRTIVQWNKDQKDSAFWKMYQVVIHEDQIAHSKRYEGSKITFEWWMMRDTIATDQSSDDKFLFIFKKKCPWFHIMYTWVANLFLISQAILPKGPVFLSVMPI